MSIKKILCALVSVSMLVSIAGCWRIPGDIWKNPNLDGVFPFIDLRLGDAFIEDWHENNVISRVTWHKLRLSEYDSGIYAELAKTFDKINREALTQAKAEMYELAPIAKELSAEEYNPIYCETTSKYYPQRADRYIVSLLQNVVVDSGGVHPNMFWNGKNYNPQTGEELLLTDVLRDTTELSSILEKKLKEKYEGIDFTALKECFDGYKLEEFTWTVDYQGITFWFSPYEIAAYSEGTPSAKIWFNEYPDMFNEEYAQAPERYAVTLPQGVDVDVDLAADDGKRDLVFVQATPDPYYGSYNMLSVVVNGKTYRDEVNYAYDFDVYLVHTAGKNYVYSESWTDNNYRMIHAMDINGSEIVQIAELAPMGIYDEYIEEDAENSTVYQQVFNDPNNFTLEGRFEVLGTREGFAAYMVSETDGTPTMKDRAFNIEDGFSVTSIIDISTELVENNTEKEFPAGTVFYPLRTDGNTYIEMKTQDGTEVRFNYNKLDYPSKVNGMPEDECFENLLYAG